MLPTAEQVWEDGRNVRKRREDNKGSHKGLECRLRPDIDAAKHRNEDSAEDDGSKWIVCVLVDIGEEAAARRSSIACQGPKDSAGGDTATNS